MGRIFFHAAQCEILKTLQYDKGCIFLTDRKLGLLCFLTCGKHDALPFLVLSSRSVRPGFSIWLNKQKVQRTHCQTERIHCFHKHTDTVTVSRVQSEAAMPRIENDIKLDFKDVLLRPKRSTLKSRSEVCLIIVNLKQHIALIIKI